MLSVGSEQVNDQIEALVAAAIESLLQDRCTAAEAEMVRRRLGQPDVARLVERAEELVVDALLIALPEVLNEALYPED
jgi:hypothetical protein